MKRYETRVRRGKFVEIAQGLPLYLSLFSAMAVQ